MARETFEIIQGLQEFEYCSCSINTKDDNSLSSTPEAENNWSKKTNLNLKLSKVFLSLDFEFCTVFDNFKL